MCDGWDCWIFYNEKRWWNIMPMRSEARWMRMRTSINILTCWWLLWVRDKIKYNCKTSSSGSELVNSLPSPTWTWHSESQQISDMLGETWIVMRSYNENTQQHIPGRVNLWILTKLKSTTCRRQNKVFYILIFFSSVSTSLQCTVSFH